MKKTLSLVVLILVTHSVAAQKISGGKNEKQKQEEEAIRAVIVKETTSFFESNKSEWKDCWVHAPHAYWSFADSVDVNFYSGWDNIEKGFTDYFRTSKPAKVKVENRWGVIRVYGTGAFAYFKQKVSGDGIDRDEQSEIRILEKDSNGNWKIVHVGVISKPVLN